MCIRDRTCTITGLENGQTYTFTVMVIVDHEVGAGNTATETVGRNDATVNNGGTGGATQGDIATLPPCPAPTLPFTDVTNVISTADIACIYGLGITRGTSRTTYSPDRPVDRDQMAAFLARLWRALAA